MVHVLDLPGCVVRALTREEALARTPEAIGEAHAWLRRHGEVAPAAEEPIVIEVAGESVGFGPFDRRSAAALFPPDREPVTPEEMERCFRLMAYARADLLALVGDLLDDVLDWQPHPESFTIRVLLRHVGNAEQWYVSRLVSPETLPPEWEQDQDQIQALPMLEFLEMERRTAVDRLRQLTDEERGTVFYPTGWTDHPQEPWTARKALRRFLEHEREHTAQVLEILSDWRTYLLAWLAAERARFLAQFIGLDEKALTEPPVFDDWTAKDLLAHVAGWDEFFTQRIAFVVAGREEEIAGVDLDARNAALHAERRVWPLERAVEACGGARRDFLTALAPMSDEELHRLRRVGWGETSVRLWTQWRAWHDGAHAAHLATWREAQGLGGTAGPKVVLLAALSAAREALLAAAALVPPEDRASRGVCGEWTLKDLLGHIVDLEWVGVDGLRDMAVGRSPQVEYIADVDAWNQAHYEARRDQPWDGVWSDLRAAREALVEVLERMGQADLSRSFPLPWGPEVTAYDWVSVYLPHDREHARDLSDAAAPWWT